MPSLSEWMSKTQICYEFFVKKEALVVLMKMADFPKPEHFRMLRDLDGAESGPGVPYWRRRTLERYFAKVGVKDKREF